MKVPTAKPYIGIEEEQAVTEVLRSGWISQGPKTAEFEQAVASFLGVTHAKAVNSGTSALHLTLMALGIHPGDEVIVPAFTCVAVLNPIELMGARPVLVDIETPGYGMNPERLAEAITPRTRAVIVAHLCGWAARIQEILSITTRHNLPVIEDMALGLGTKIGKAYVGTFGDAACLSFHPRKMITTGEGGMMVTNSSEIADLVDKLRNYGASVSAFSRHSGNLFDLPEYEHAGLNYKLTDIQACIGLEQVRKLPAMLEVRRRQAGRYTRELVGLQWLQLPTEVPGTTHAYQSYVCNVREKPGETARAFRRRLYQHLATSGVASVQGAQAMTTVSYYTEKYGWKGSDYPVSTRADDDSVSLPIYPGMSTEEQDHVIAVVRSFQP